jgi:hypothetical protein
MINPVFFRSFTSSWLEKWIKMNERMLGEFETRGTEKEFEHDSERGI